jgi:hypothetical protein
MEDTDDNIRILEELEDGSAIYEIGEEIKQEKEKEEKEFSANLADDLSEDARSKLANYLLESIDEDIKSRQSWIDAVQKVIDYLGFSLEDVKNAPFNQASRTYDTTLASIVLRFYATNRSELLPESGPAGFRINGPSNEELIQKGTKRRDYLNYYLTMVDKSYYTDFERFLLYLPVYGSGFKKVYFDKLLNRPISRFILPEDFIIDGDCTSILESERITHVLHLSKREIIFNQQNDIYRDAELPYLKTSENNDAVTNSDTDTARKKDVDLDAYTKSSLFPIYESHAYLNLKDFTHPETKYEKEDEMPLPYIVTIDKNSKELLSLRKNWKKDDELFQRINYFIQYNCLPGFGVYGLGYAQMMGTNSITLTTLLRQLVDAGSFKNLPGGLRTKAFKQQDNDLLVGPGQFVGVDTGGMPLKDSFMPLPYSEPSSVLRELRLEIIDQCRELGSSSELGMMDSKEDIPVGTVMAMLEQHTKVQSAIQKSIHRSLSMELQMIDSLLKESMESEIFKYGESEHIINAEEDFVDEVEIIPVSDPSTNSTIQRIVKAESILRLSQQAPELHNMREVYKLNYQAIGLDTKEIEKILKPEITPEEIAMQEQMQQQAIDPQAVVMADIEQKAAETAAKERIANQKAETDIFKAQLDFEKEKAKIESSEDIAQLKAETELTKQGVTNYGD